MSKLVKVKSLTNSSIVISIPDTSVKDFIDSGKWEKAFFVEGLTEEEVRELLGSDFTGAQKQKDGTYALDSVAWENALDRLKTTQVSDELKKRVKDE